MAEDYIWCGAVYTSMYATATPNPSVGLVGKTPQYTGIPYLLPGKYYLVCLVAGHAVAGMCDWLTVPSPTTVPSIQVTK